MAKEKSKGANFNKGKNSSGKVKHVFKFIGSLFLLILKCIWQLVCVIVLTDFILDIIDKDKK